MKSWAHAVKGLKPDFVAKVDEVVSRRTRLKREFEQATEEEIALIQEVQAMNLRPKNSGENTGKLDADMVAAMDRDVFFAYAKRGPAPRKADRAKPKLLKDLEDPAAVQELWVAFTDLAEVLVGEMKDTQQAEKLREVTERTKRELADDPLGIRAAYDSLPKKYDPDQVDRHAGLLIEHLNNNVDASLARRSEGKLKGH